MKNKRIIAVAIGLIVVSGLALGLGLSHLRPASTETTKSKLFVNSKEFKLELADTESERIRGLSGREKLDEDRAMLFVFPESAEQCMWMKDMKFSLDMVWLDSSRKITKIERNVSPNTYPQAFCADNAKYVLEFNAGVTEDTGLKIGQNLNF